jgi:Fur family ferric uptake transcriptional regulator
MTNSISTARRILAPAGRRTTNQRAAILEVLRHNVGHLDADEVYRLAKQRDARLSLSTVYRTLSLLKQLGEVDELHLAEEHHHYEATGLGTFEHYHLVCLGCGHVVEFASDLTEALKAEQAVSNGFAVTGAHIDLAGFCGACRAAGRDRLPVG